ncbi:proline-rich protein HaeIII subfamily 1-like [Prinia subflava]|uniref:proline-rich protein HaeIII subfamily 1-like n=1 Tax=Prinia subflava TaxID=208062 RepID=UPI002FE0A3EB
MPRGRTPTGVRLPAGGDPRPRRDKAFSRRRPRPPAAGGPSPCPALPAPAAMRRGSPGLRSLPPCRPRRRSGGVGGSGRHGAGSWRRRSPAAEPPSILCAEEQPAAPHPPRRHHTPRGRAGRRARAAGPPTRGAAAGPGGDPRPRGRRWQRSPGGAEWPLWRRPLPPPRREHGSFLPSLCKWLHHLYEQHSEDTGFLRELLGDKEESAVVRQRPPSSQQWCSEGPASSRASRCRGALSYTSAVLRCCCSSAFLLSRGCCAGLANRRNTLNRSFAVYTTLLVQTTLGRALP